MKNVLLKSLFSRTGLTFLLFHLCHVSATVSFPVICVMNRCSMLMFLSLITLNFFRVGRGDFVLPNSRIWAIATNTGISSNQNHPELIIT